MGMAVFATDHRLINIIQTNVLKSMGGLLFLWETAGKKQTNSSFIKRIGAATYVVNVHFSETDSATLEDRLLHLIRNDVCVNGLPVMAEE